MRLKVGVIGCGRIASSIDDERSPQWRGGVVPPLAHAGGYAETTDVTELVAACDVDGARLAEFRRRWNVPRGYRDFRELIDAEQPDILSICTRPEQHAEAMIYGAEHGVKGMFAEKPLCCTLREADAIREAFERAGVMLEFGPPRRNWTVYQQARAIAAERRPGARAACGRLLGQQRGRPRAGHGAVPGRRPGGGHLDPRHAGHAQPGAGGHLAHALRQGPVDPQRADRVRRRPGHRRGRHRQPGVRAGLRRRTHPRPQRRRGTGGAQERRRGPASTRSRWSRSSTGAARRARSATWCRRSAPASRP